jgi:hypothetical protein
MEYSPTMFDFQFSPKEQVKRLKTQKFLFLHQERKVGPKKKQRSVALPVVLISCEKSLVTCKELP